MDWFTNSNCFLLDVILNNKKDLFVSDRFLLFDSEIFGYTGCALVQTQRGLFEWCHLHYHDSIPLGSRGNMLGMKA